MRKVSGLKCSIGFLVAACAMFLMADIARAAEPRRIEIHLAHGKPVNGDVIRLKQGDTVVLEWISDEALSLHLHGYDIEVTLVPNEKQSTPFEAFASGRFPLTNHGAGHGHKALMYFEVLRD